MKAYTDLEQSRKLTEILPPESADMCWTNHCYGVIRSSMTISAKTVDEYKNLLNRFYDSTSIDVFYPAWSLAALLSVLPDVHLKKYIYEDITKYYATLIGIRQFNSKHYDNPVDACYEMIIKLHELKML